MYSSSSKNFKIFKNLKLFPWTGKFSFIIFMALVIDLFVFTPSFSAVVRKWLLNFPLKARDPVSSMINSWILKLWYSSHLKIYCELQVFLCSLIIFPSWRIFCLPECWIFQISVFSWFILLYNISTNSPRRVS